LIEVEPVVTSALIGREADLAVVTRLLQSQEHRLVTLTGLGGVGKTSLAREVVSRMHGQFEQGTVFANP
jgi:predicted ATPase